MLTLRASSLPLVLKCPPAAQKPELLIDLAGDPAERGTQVHAMLATYIVHNIRGRVADKETMILFNAGASMWDQIAEHFPDPMVEQEMEFVLDGGFGAREVARVTAHPDVVSFTEEDGKTTIRILDWKSGRVRSDYMDQLKAYALAACRHIGGNRVIMTIGWLRDMELETVKFALHELEDWEHVAAANLLAGGEKYKPSERCAWCPRAGECPARKELVQRPIEDLVGWQSVALRELPGHMLETLRTRSKLVRQAADQFDAMLKQELEMNGPIQLDDGRRLALVEKSREKINAVEAIPHLTLLTYLSDLDVRSICKISKGDLLDAVGANAPKGKKGARQKEVMEELREIGAVTKSTYRTVAVETKLLEADDEQ